MTASIDVTTSTPKKVLIAISNPSVSTLVIEALGR